MRAIRFFIIPIILLTTINDTISLRMIEVIVPTYRVRGETALLECRYDLERDTLYSVKWYRNDVEFYRFLPKLEPMQKSYWLEGVRVDDSQSDDQRVILKSVNLKTSGVFTCEVSAEKPSFKSVQGGGRMEVVYFPKDGPVITGKEIEYTNGDILDLNCTSGRSYPASSLLWFINDEKVTDRYLLTDYPEVVHAHGLITSKVGLRLMLSLSHFGRAAIRVRCAAHLSPVLWRGHSSTTVPAAPLIDNREALLLVRSFGTRIEVKSAIVLLQIVFYIIYTIKSKTLQGEKV